MLVYWQERGAAVETEWEEAVAGLRAASLARWATAQLQTTTTCVQSVPPVWRGDGAGGRGGGWRAGWRPGHSPTQSQAGLLVVEVLQSCVVVVLVFP